MLIIPFFKAIQHALFSAPITVQGHTRASTGAFVAPYASRRKKRLDAPRAGDLFGPKEHPVHTHVATTEPPELTLQPSTPVKNPATARQHAQRIKARMDNLFAESKGRAKAKLSAENQGSGTGTNGSGGGSGGNSGGGSNGNGNGGGDNGGSSGGGGADESPPRAFQVTATRKGKEVRFDIENAFFTWLQLAPHAIWADVDRLQVKHPEYFSSPDAVQQHIHDVLAGAEIAMPATHPAYTLLVTLRENADHQAATVEFVLRGGKYRVRNAQKMPQSQLDVKLNRAGNVVRVRRGSRDSTVPPRTTEPAVLSARSPVPPSDGPPAKPKTSIPLAAPPDKEPAHSPPPKIHLKGKIVEEARTGRQQLALRTLDKRSGRSAQPQGSSEQPPEAIQPAPVQLASSIAQTPPPAKTTPAQAKPAPAAPAVSKPTAQSAYFARTPDNQKIPLQDAERLDLSTDPDLSWLKDTNHQFILHPAIGPGHKQIKDRWSVTLAELGMSIATAVDSRKNAILAAKKLLTAVGPYGLDDQVNTIRQRFADSELTQKAFPAHARILFFKAA